RDLWLDLVGKRLRNRAADSYIVPMAVILREIAISGVRVEEQILVPVVILGIDRDGAALEADHLVRCALPFSSRAQENERLNFFPAARLIENLQLGVSGVEHAAAT